MTRARPFVADRITGFAASSVFLGLAAIAAAVRMSETWSDGQELAVLAGAATIFYVLGLLGPLVVDRPAAGTSVLLVVGLLIALPALMQFAVVIGVDEPFDKSGTLTWIFAAWGALAAFAAVRKGSAIAALLAAVGAGSVVLTGADWIFELADIDTFRYLLTGLVVVYFLAGLAAGGSRPRHGAVLVDAAGLAAVLLGVLLTVEVLAGLFGSVVSGFLQEDSEDAFNAFGQPWGWQLVLLLAGLALVAYSGRNREPGPGYLAVVVLVEFLIVAVIRFEEHPSIKGWPLALLITGSALLVLTLRPRRRR